MRIAHISDTHLLEHDHAERSLSGQAKLAYLSFFRPLDAADRVERLTRALEAAADADPDHLVITGDLTEDGHPEQFEVLAEVLRVSRFPPSAVTLVPGNHDAYGPEDAWEDALEGPLRAFAATSTPGTSVDLGAVVVVPLSSAIRQPITRSGGAIDRTALAHAARVAVSDKRAALLVQHHPPIAHARAATQWIDGLRDHDAVRRILAASVRAHVVSGHAHRGRDHAVDPVVEPRVFTAPAVVDHPAPLRVYEVDDGALRPIAALRRASANVA